MSLIRINVNGGIKTFDEGYMRFLSVRSCRRCNSNNISLMREGLSGPISNCALACDDCQHEVSAKTAEEVVKKWNG